MGPRNIMNFNGFIVRTLFNVKLHRRELHKELTNKRDRDHKISYNGKGKQPVSTPRR